MPTIKHKLKITIIISLIIAVVLSLFFLLGLFQNINLKLTDNLYGGKTPTNSIIIIGVDNKSLSEIGRWPWKRDIYAKAFENLSDAKVIGVDISFFENSSEQDDAILAKAIEKQKGKIVLTSEYTSYDFKNKILIGKNIITPISQLKELSPNSGYINLPLDKDGVNRRVYFIEGDYVSFSEKIYSIYTNTNQTKLREDYKDNELLINFVNKPGSFTTYSFSDLVNRRLDKELFSNKIVLIGATASDFHDEYLTPTSNGTPMSGVEIHANAISTMLTKNYLHKQSNLSLIIAIFIISILCGLLLLKFPIKFSVPLLIIIIIIYLIFAILIFKNGIILNLIYIPLTIIISSFGNISYFYIFEEREKKKTVNAFSKYVSSEVVQELLKDPSKLKLGGEKKKVTLLFSDIRNFTTISEKLTPEQVISMLNIYLDKMSESIIEEKGLIDKYIGDAIMAFWGAPLPEKNHAILACNAAIKMNKHLTSVKNQLSIEMNLTDFRIGIGIHSGDAIVGNIGSSKRFDYTAIGDTVNLASRIEGLTKEYGLTILISEFTFSQLNDNFYARKIDLVSVKGRTKPIFVYELIENKINNKLSQEEIKEIKTIIENYEKGFDLYLKRDFKKAIFSFEDVLKIRQQDLPSRIMISRCKAFITNPPEKEWSGVYKMEKK
ncbi:MAG: adenylate/guanylate cyclase domain-containing protein [archaeon]